MYVYFDYLYEYKAARFMHDIYLYILHMRTNIVTLQTRFYWTVYVGIYIFAVRRTKHHIGSISTITCFREGTIMYIESYYVTFTTRT